jgi:hypothetical protein
MNVYSVSELSPATWKVPDPDCVRITTMAPGEDIAVYESIVAPPFDAGAVNVSEIVVAFTTDAVPITGAPEAVTPPPPPPVTTKVIVERTVPREFVAEIV